MNEYANAWLFLSHVFGHQTQLSEKLDLEDFEEIFPFFTSTYSKKRKRGYIFQMKVIDGIQTRIILVAPKHYLSAQL